MFCHPPPFLHDSRMKPVLWIPAFCAFALALSSCGNSGNSGTQQAGTGPFDRNGRYVEEWADNPSKWRKAGKAPSPHELRSDEVPEIAQNEQPPQNANPLAPTRQSKPAPVISQTQVTTKPKSTVKTDHHHEHGHSEAGGIHHCQAQAEAQTGGEGQAQAEIHPLRRQERRFAFRHRRPHRLLGLRHQERQRHFRHPDPARPVAHDSEEVRSLPGGFAVDRLVECRCGQVVSARGRMAAVVHEEIVSPTGGDFRLPRVTHRHHHEFSRVFRPRRGSPREAAASSRGSRRRGVFRSPSRRPHV